MNDYNSFVNIFKYHDKLENYTTELFVFVLNYLKHSKSLQLKKILKNIINEFGFNNILDLKNLQIETQLHLETDEGEKVIPDIVIKYNKIKTIIEVKVNSPLIDQQLESYEKVRGLRDVYLLSKNIINIENPENIILWSKIHSIINNTEDFVLLNFKKHLEENSMNSYPPIDEKIFCETLSISEETSSKPSVKILAELMKQAWPYNDYHSYSVSSCKKWKNWIRFFIKEKNKKILWIGLKEETEEIWAEIIDNKLKEKLKEKEFCNNFEIDGNSIWFNDSLNLRDIINKYTIEEQKEFINDWYLKLMKNIKNICNQKTCT
jgi:hypothetical protein